MIRFSVLFLMLMPMSVPADDSPDRPSENELVALEQFLKLSDEQLDQLIAALKRLRAMDERQRGEFASEVLSFRALPVEERRNLREGWGQRGRAASDEWREMVRELDPREHRKLQQHLQSLTPEERVRFRSEKLREWRQSRVESGED